DPTDGANDYIFAANGMDVVLGGSGNDVIDAGLDTSRDVVVGDNGYADFNTSGVLVKIQTTVPSIGGNDDILVGDGPDVVLGGVGVDYINMDRATQAKIGTDSGLDIILGDNGLAEFQAVNGQSVLTHIETTDPGIGDDDFVFASDGPDVVLGGKGKDTIDAGTDGGGDVIVGDNG